MQHRGDDFEPANHVPRIGVPQVVGRVVKACRSHRLVDAGRTLLAWQIVQLGEDPQVFITSEHAVGGQQLRNIADRTPDERWLAEQIVAGEFRGTARRRQQSHQHLHQSAFARSVGAEQAEHLALANSERQPVHGSQTTESLRERVRFDNPRSFGHKRSVLLGSGWLGFARQNFVRG